MALFRAVFLSIVALVAAGCVMLGPAGAPHYEASKVAGLKMPVTFFASGDMVAVGSDKASSSDVFDKRALEVQHGLISGLVERGVQVSEILAMPTESDAPKREDLVFNTDFHRALSAIVPAFLHF